jgi:hypothetical protein
LLNFKFLNSLSDVFKRGAFLVFDGTGSESQKIEKEGRREMEVPTPSCLVRGLGVRT